MELNKEACEAAVGAFMEKLGDKPTTGELLGALRLALETYESVRVAPAPAGQQETHDAARYRAIKQLMETAKGSAHLTVNQHLAYYDEPEPGQEVSLQWYPDTPIGFYTIECSTLDEVADEAIEATSRAQRTDNPS